MNASTRRELQKAVATAKTSPEYAAATLAGLLRAAPTTGATAALYPYIDSLGLRPYMEVVNGCMVAKVPA